jgi:hypothetical protein
MSGPVPPPIQASDPARLTNGQVVPREAVDMPTGGSYTVDLERAPQTLQDLTAARDELTELLADTERLGKVDPGSADQVSQDAAALLGAVAAGGDGSLLLALRAGIDRLNELINGIAAELSSYRETEATSRGAFDESRT